MAPSSAVKAAIAAIEIAMEPLDRDERVRVLAGTICLTDQATAEAVLRAYANQQIGKVNLNYPPGAR